MIFPTIHTNGTSRERLLDGYSAARAKVRAAITALESELKFNGRDYYPKAPTRGSRPKSNMPRGFGSCSRYNRN
jgi:hypothetical protein